MDISNLTIKDVERIFDQDEVTQDFLFVCGQDSRVAIGKLLKRYERQQAERQRLLGMYRYENEAIARGLNIVAGVDEAGRGPLAGPVSVAAVILPENWLLPKLNDSKKLSAVKREQLYEEITKKAVAYGVGMRSPERIDEINIYQASKEAMIKAIHKVQKKLPLEYVLTDAMPMQLDIPVMSIVKGDAKCYSISAASIIAKVTRDRIMRQWDEVYPQYGFAKHKGYGTAEHIAAIKEYGLCPLHRLSFVKNIVK